MGQYHFHPDDYLELMRSEMPGYDRLQEATAAATGERWARRALELGVGTGETARRVLERHPDATLLGIDVSAEMLAQAAQTLPGERVTLRQARLEDPLPADESFDLVVSALSIHHLDGSGKAALFRRIAAALAPGGVFVMSDVVVPDDPADAVTPIDDDYDLPSAPADLLRWLAAAGLREPRIVWAERDLAVFVAGARQAPAAGVQSGLE